MLTALKTAILIFINNVASLAIEQCLLAGLPEIFSSATIRDMSDETIKVIASEPPSTLTERMRLRERVEILRRGIKTVRRIQPSKFSQQDKYAITEAVMRRSYEF